LMGANGEALKPITVDLDSADTLEITAVEGSIHLTQSAGNAAVVAISRTRNGVESDDDWRVTTERQGHRVSVTVRMPESRTALVALLKNEKLPRFQINVRAPARSVILSLRRGSLTVDGFSAAVRAQLQSGELVVNGGEGDLRLVHQDGSVSVHSHRGPLHIETFQGRVTVQDNTGDFDGENFLGESVLKNINGSLNFSSSKGVTKIATVQGRLDFWQGRGNLTAENLNGPVRGQSVAGAIQLGVTGESDVRVTTQEAPVTINLADSSARLDLNTRDGNIFVPNYLHVTDMGSQKMVRGHLKGANSGAVMVKTESGNIRVK
jgi:DUF4097 and DUF4098 domain-containing protein YvlB